MSEVCVWFKVKCKEKKYIQINLASVSCVHPLFWLFQEKFFFFCIFYNFLKFVWSKSMCFQSPSLYRGSMYSFLHLFQLIMYPRNNSVVVYSLDFSLQQECWYTMIYSAFPLLMNIWIISSLLLLKLVLQWIVLCCVCVCVCVYVLSRVGRRKQWWINKFGLGIP